MTDFQPLDPNHRKLQRLIGGCLSILVILVATAILTAIAVATDSLTGPFAIVAAIALPIVLLSIWAGWIYPGKAYRRASWRLADDSLEIRQGVWWRHQIIVPRSRVQHSDIEQGPLQRGMGISTLIVHTAGTKNASVKLEGLKHEVSQKLRDTLIASVSHSALAPAEPQPIAAVPARPASTTHEEVMEAKLVDTCEESLDQLDTVENIETIIDEPPEADDAHS
ncbi:MAG: PH domain-containing protein [Rubripirellula sp.]